MTYQFPADAKPRVRKVVLNGVPCWEAGRPYGMYLYGEGFHFNRWEDAIRYATGRTTWQFMARKPLEAGSWIGAGRF